MVTWWNRSLAPGLALLTSHPWYKVEEGFQERLDSRYVNAFHAVYRGYRDSLGDGDRCGGEVCNLALKWVSRLPPLYPAGNSDIYSPFEIEILTRFDDRDDSGWGPLTRASPCTLVSPGSDNKPLLRRRTQCNVPPSS